MVRRDPDAGVGGSARYNRYMELPIERHGGFDSLADAAASFLNEVAALTHNQTLDAFADTDFDGSDEDAIDERLELAENVLASSGLRVRWCKPSDPTLGYTIEYATQRPGQDSNKPA